MLRTQPVFSSLQTALQIREGNWCHLNAASTPTRSGSTHAAHIQSCPATLGLTAQYSHSSRFWCAPELHSWEAAELCAALCQHIWVCSEIGLIFTVHWCGTANKERLWILHATFLVKYHSLQESLLDFAQSGKQAPACTQQLTLFLRGYDISHDVSLTSRTQTPLLPSLLLSLGVGSPRDPFPLHLPPPQGSTIIKPLPGLRSQA